MKLSFRIPITVKIVLVSALLAGIFLLTSFGYAVTQMSDELQNSSIDLLEARVQNEDVRITTTTDEIQKTVQALSKTPPFQGIIRSENNDGIDPLDGSSSELWKTRLQTIFTAEIEAIGYYGQLRYIDFYGNEIVRVDRDGQNAKVVSEELLQNKADRQYFIDANSTPPGEVFVSRSELNKEGQPPQVSIPPTPVIRYAVPIFDEVTGVRYGILIANVLLDEIMTFDAIQENDAESFIVNTAGFYIVHPDESKEWGGVLDLNTGENFYKDFDNVTSDDFIDENGKFEKDEHLYVYSKIHPDPTDDSRSWVVVQRADTDILFAKIQSIVAQSIMIGLGTFVVLFFVFLISIKRLLSPLRDLAKAASEIGEGHFDQRVVVESNDEIGMLAKVLNTMAEKLELLYGRLESRVQQRTLELENEKNRIESIIHGVSDPLCVIDLETRVTMLNRASEGLSLFDAESSIGKNLFDVFSIANQEHVSVIRQLLDDSGNRKVQITMKEAVTIIDAKHQPHQFYLDVSPMINESGIVRGSVLIFRNVAK